MGKCQRGGRPARAGREHGIAALDGALLDLRRFRNIILVKDIFDFAALGFGAKVWEAFDEKG